MFIFQGKDNMLHSDRTYLPYRCTDLIFNVAKIVVTTPDLAFALFDRQHIFPLMKWLGYRCIIERDKVDFQYTLDRVYSGGQFQKGVLRVGWRMQLSVL